MFRFAGRGVCLLLAMKLSMFAQMGLPSAPAATDRSAVLEHAAAKSSIEILSSEYVKQKFPAVKLTFRTFAEPQTELSTSDVELFRALQYARGMSNGKVRNRDMQAISNGILADSAVTQTEERIVDLLRSGTTFTVAFTGEGERKPVTLTPTLDAEGVAALANLQANGMQLTTTQVMLKKLWGSKFPEWVKMFRGNEQEKSVALAFLRFQMFTYALQSDLANQYGPVRQFLFDLNGSSNVLLSSDRKDVLRAIFKDFSAIQADLGAALFPDYVLNIINPDLPPPDPKSYK